MINDQWYILPLPHLTNNNIRIHDDIDTNIVAKPSHDLLHPVRINIITNKFPIGPICGKRFTASSNLYYHRMTHNKVSVTVCGYGLLVPHATPLIQLMNQLVCSSWLVACVNHCLSSSSLSH